MSCTLLLCDGGELESSETVPSSSSTMIEARVPEVCLVRVSGQGQRCRRIGDFGPAPQGRTVQASH